MLPLSRSKVHSTDSISIKSFIDKNTSKTLDRLENKIESDFASLKEDYDW